MLFNVIGELAAVRPCSDTRSLRLGDLSLGVHQRFLLTLVIGAHTMRPSNVAAPLASVVPSRTVGTRLD